MAIQNYSELLKDPRWQRRRLTILSRDTFTCQLCGDSSTELQVHHLYYALGRDPWDYSDESLITYCKHCHALAEAVKPYKGTLLLVAKRFPLNRRNPIVLSALIRDDSDMMGVCIAEYELTNRVNILICRSASDSFQVSELVKLSDKLLKNQPTDVQE